MPNLILNILFSGLLCWPCSHTLPAQQTAPAQPPIYETRRDHDPEATGKFYLGREIAQHRDYSEETALKIDAEVKLIVQNAYDRAKAILEEKREMLIRIAEALLVREVLEGQEVYALIRGEELAPRSGDGKGGKKDEGQTQQVLRPEGGLRLPGLTDGERPQPA